MCNLHSLKVCYFGTYRENYSRNQMMIAGLRLNGVEVITCHETLWHGIEDRVQTASGGWVKPAFWGRLFGTYCRLIRQYFRLDDYDILVVGYPGQLDVYLARILSWIKHKQMVWDAFMSLYLISIERGLHNNNKLSIRLLHFLERFAVRLPDLLILDTMDYANWFSQEYGINSDNFRLVPTGADDRFFLPIIKSNNNDKFVVLYAGSFIPNHGVRYIIDAARLLKDEPQIELVLIGEGPELEYTRQFVEQNWLMNVRFIDWMDKGDLVKAISLADVCLGAFGITPQSMMTVQNKIYEALAMGKALISGDSPAIRKVCTHGEDIYLCERASGEAISEAILELRKKPELRDKIAKNGYKLFIENYSISKNGMRYKSHLLELIG